MATNLASSSTTHTGNGSTNVFAISFPFLSDSEIDVFVGGVLKTFNTHYTISGSSLTFTSGNTPANGTSIKFQRDTDISTKKVDFSDGSVLTEFDLDSNADQILFGLQEFVDIVNNDLYKRDGTTTITGSIVFEGSSDDANETTLSVTNPTADRTITFPDITGTVITSADTGTVNSTMIANGTIVNADINANADIAVSKLDHGTARQILQTNAAGNNVEFTSDVDIDSLNVDGTTTLDATTVDGTLTATSVTVGGLTISHTIDNGSPHRSVLLHDATDDLRLQIARNQMIFEKSDGVNFISLTHSTDANDPEINGRVNISHAGHGVKITTKTDGIKVTGKVDLDSITGTGVVTSGTSTSDTQVYSAKRAGEIFYQKGTLSEIQSGETWSSDDQKVATTAAIDARIIDLVDDVGGFVPIANETSFPNANPDVNNGAGTLVSVPLANNLTSNSSGVITIANGTVGNSTVTITGATASSTFAQGFGIIVETTSTLNTYTFHRYVPKATEVTTVAGSISNVNTVATNISNVNAVGTNISNVNSVAGNASNINSAVSNASNINAAVSNATNINTVAGNNTNISTVAGISANVTTVAGINSDVTTIANNITNVNNVGNNINNVVLAGINSTNITSAVNNASNINTVAGISGNVTTVAGISSNVTTVANDGTDIGLVAGSIGNVNTTAGSIANVNTVAGSIANVNTVGTNITNVTNASNYLNNFLQLYLGEASSNPSVDGLGNAVTEGDLYFNTVDKRIRVFNGSVFQNIGEGLVEVAKFATAAFNTLYTASAGSNNIDLGGLAVTGAVFSNEAIAANRVSLGKGSGTFNLGGI